MQFELLPIIDLMLDLYAKPRSVERFNDYLKLLQGDKKGELAMPISGFNPMARVHVLQKLSDLEALNAEQLVQEILLEINKQFADTENKDCFKVAINICDDLLGSWTNGFTTDFDSKFKLNALVNRQFCTPIFWTSEEYLIDDEYSTKLIKERILESVYRTIYWCSHSKPKTLKEHFDQERFVAQYAKDKYLYTDLDIQFLKQFYEQHQESEDYHLIFNFFYGDNASDSLAFPCFGIKDDWAGFEYAQFLGNK